MTEKVKQGLKPCPFCGETERLVSSIRAMDEYWCNGDRIMPIKHYVHCLNCGGRTSYHETLKEAIDAWNRRAEGENND